MFLLGCFAVGSSWGRWSCVFLGDVLDGGVKHDE